MIESFLSIFSGRRHVGPDGPMATDIVAHCPIVTIQMPTSALDRRCSRAMPTALGAGAGAFALGRRATVEHEMLFDINAGTTLLTPGFVSVESGTLDARIAI